MSRDKRRPATSRRALNATDSDGEGRSAGRHGAGERTGRDDVGRSDREQSGPSRPGRERDRDRDREATDREETRPSRPGRDREATARKAKDRTGATRKQTSGGRMLTSVGAPLAGVAAKSAGLAKSNPAAFAAAAAAAVAIGLGLFAHGLWIPALLLAAAAIGLAAAGRRRSVTDPAAGGGHPTLWAAAAGVAALILGLIAAFDGSVDPIVGNPQNRAAFCEQQGDALYDASVTALRGPDDLLNATDEIIKLSEAAPSESECAVIALDGVASAWQINSKLATYDGADEQIKRIRDFQAERHLIDPVF